MAQATRGLRAGRHGWLRPARLRRLRNWGAFGLVLTGPLLAVLTYMVMGPLDRGSGSDALRLVLLADMIYVLIVAWLVLQRVARMIAARRSRSAGSQAAPAAHRRVRGDGAPADGRGGGVRHAVDQHGARGVVLRSRGPRGGQLGRRRAGLRGGAPARPAGRCAGAGAGDRRHAPRLGLHERRRYPAGAVVGAARDPARAEGGLRHRRHRRDPRARRAVLPVRFRAPDSRPDRAGARGGRAGDPRLGQ